MEKGSCKDCLGNVDCGFAALYITFVCLHYMFRKRLLDRDVIHVVCTDDDGNCQKSSLVHSPTIAQPDSEPACLQRIVLLEPLDILVALFTPTKS